MKTARLLYAAVLAVSFLSAASVAFADQKLLPAQSEIVFVSKQMGVPVEGRFKKFDAQLAFDPAKPETSKIAFTVDVASATLGVPETDAELPKATWFNTSKFPQATFGRPPSKVWAAASSRSAARSASRARPATSWSRSS